MDASQAKPICPRCGYDLEGLIATWVESCPLQSTCSECGLEFECSRALSPHLIGPRWSYEHGFRPEVKRWWATSLMSLLPRKMFGDLAVDHRINPRRLVRFVVVWLLAAHIATATVSLASAYFEGTLMPVFRGAGVSLDWSFSAELLRRFAFPYFYQLSIPSGPRSWSRVPLMPLFLIVYVPTFFMSVWMLLLGTSLRMARVRKLQLLRGFAFSLPCAAAYIVAMLATIIMIPMLGGFTGVLIPAMAFWGVMLLCFGHHLYWWFLFIRRYLRLRHAAAVVLVHTVMNVLVLMIAMVVLSNWGMRF